MKSKWFEKRGTLQTLVYLYEMGKANQKKIVTAIGITNDTLKESVIPELEEHDLIVKEREKRFPFSINIELTEKGKKIAVKLSEAGIIDFR